MSDSPDLPLRDALLDAALPHVVFDGWSDATLRAAIADTAADPVLARAEFPRGGVDLALAHHARGDAEMRRHATALDLTAMRYSARVAALVKLRIELAGARDAIRRATTLFALPQHASDGARAIWGTADAIWDVLGDTSGDVNWYSKRAILSGVYASTVLFWLGDTSPNAAATWEFLDRRIANVMQFEKIKAGARKNPILKALMAGPARVLDHIKAPPGTARDHLPGRW